jgi:hypothetical protein
VPEEFNIEEREYKSVFKMFEKGASPGEIHISTVFDFINKFDQASATKGAEPLPKTQQKEPGATTHVAALGGVGSIRTQGTFT